MPVMVEPASEPPRGAWLLRGSRPWYALVILLACVPLFVGLRNVDLESDEAGHSYTVDVMLSDGDWLTPKSCPYKEYAFLEKPPLKFWIVAAPIKLGLLPNDEFGLRFWDALFGSAAFLYLFALGRLMGGPVCGLAAVLILFAQRPLLFDHGLRGNNMEAMLVLAYCAGIYHFLRWRTSESARTRRLHIVAITLYFVAAFMMKFVAAMFLPAVLFISILVRPADWRRVSRDWLAWLGGVALALLLIAPWFIYEYHRFGAELWNTMFAAHVYQRFTTYLDPAHLRPWHFYLSTIWNELVNRHAVIVVVGGWCLVLLRLIRTGWPEGSVVLLSAALPLTVISFGSSKLYHYAYPFLPAFAVAGGYFASETLKFLGPLVGSRLRFLERVLPALRRAADWRAVQALLAVIVVSAVAIAIGTHITGRLRLTVGDVLLLRNSDPLRPWAIAALAGLVLVRRPEIALRLVVPLFVLALLPVGAYEANLRDTRVEHHQVRAMRDCLRPIAIQHGSPGVYADLENGAHTYFYYFRDLGPYTIQTSGGDSAIFGSLYAPSALRPVLVSQERLSAFARAARNDTPALARIAARRSGTDADTVQASAAGMLVAYVRIGKEVLALPGPYSACGFGEESGSRYKR